jgi:hypothetical protein
VLAPVFIMNIGLIDNDLCTRKGSHFPNLALMKLSSYHKSIGDNVELINIDEMNGLFQSQYDKVYCAKVFSDTVTPEYMQNKGVIFGGSGFYYDKAEKLPNEIEHIKPDYTLYSERVLNRYVAINRTQYFTDFSLGFTTRGCIRRCAFCINKNERTVYKHSELSEFVDVDRPFIMMLDDNIVAYDKFEEIFEQLNATGKPFVYKQGMDFRLLDKRKMDVIFNSNYYSHSENQQKGARIFHFAFDNYADRKHIESNLNIYYTNKAYAFKVIFYVLTGFDRANKYDANFFEKDFEEILKRCEILFKYNAYPYLMFHENFKLNPHKEHMIKLRQIINTPMKYTNKTILEAMEQSGMSELIDFIKLKYEWFLKLRFESRMLARS